MTALRTLTLAYGPGEIESHIPLAVVTGTGDDLRPRLRVEDGATAFYEGRAFRSFMEYNIAAGQSAVMRVIITRDIIATAREVHAVEGKVRVMHIVGGTESGTWTDLTVFRRNNMLNQPTPMLVTGTTLSTGGSISGGTVVDLRLLEVANGQPQQQAALHAPTGLPPITTYVKIENVGSSAARGVYVILWEEELAASARLY